MRLFENLGALGARLAVAGAVALGGLLWAAGAAHAVPTLQVGAPAGPDDSGTYADYGNGTDPTEDDTAFTSGGTIYVAGIYGGNAQNPVLNLGGQSGSGVDWSSVKYQGNNFFPSAFDGAGAVLVVSVPDGTLATALGSLKVDGLFAFHSSEETSFFPNNHAPVQDSVADFLFFDIGDFANNPDAVPNFDEGDANEAKADGEIKTLLITGFGDLAWIHFDVMALETSQQGATRIVTSLENNPGSHDLTWKPDGPGPDPDIDVPEPGTLGLLGAGLLGLGTLLRRRKP